MVSSTVLALLSVVLATNPNPAPLVEVNCQKSSNCLGNLIGSWSVYPTNPHHFYKGICTSITYSLFPVTNAPQTQQGSEFAFTETCITQLGSPNSMPFSGRPKNNFQLQLTIPLQEKVLQGVLSFTKLWMRDRVVVAAAVTHPFVHAVAKGHHHANAVSTFWFNDNAFSPEEKERFMNEQKKQRFIDIGDM